MLGESQEISLQEVDEKALHAILEVISDGVWDWNANTGFVYRNPGWYTMLGYSPHTLGNTVFTWEGVIHPEDLERVDNPLKIDGKQPDVGHRGHGREDFAT